jgi:signal transduction histidine kinase
MKKSIKRLIPICFIALGIGLLGAFILAHTMARPISLIVQSIRDVANGHLEPLPLINRKDEIGSIAVELNKTIARLKELDDMKREFIASVTHELRSPLTAIERFVSLTLKGTYGPLSPEQQETLLTVKNNTIRLSSFIDDVLTSAKLEE